MSETAATRFPDGFLWGAATSSFQIEGAVDEDGRGPSIWDTLCHHTSLVRDGHTGDVAADHYNRMPPGRGPDAPAWLAGVSLQRRLAADPAHRFGRGQPGLASTSTRASSTSCWRPTSSPCSRSTTGTCPRRSRTPAAGRLARHAMRFADYAAIVFEALHDRVGLWATLNEPWCSSLLGYADRVTCTGPVRSSTGHACHPSPQPRPRSGGRGHARHRSRAAAGYRAQPHDRSTALDPTPMVRSPTECAAMTRCVNRVWTEPILRARYPDDVIEDLAAFGGLPVEAGDLEVIAAAARLARPQLLQGRLPRGAAGRHHPPHAGTPGSGRGPPRGDDGHGLAHHARWTARAAGPAQGDLSRPAARLYHRERLCLRRSRRRRRLPRSPADRLPRGTPARAPGRHRRRRGRARLLRVVADGQLRVVARLPQAVRHRPRGLRHARAHPAGQRLLVPRRHRPQRLDAVDGG